MKTNGGTLDRGLRIAADLVLIGLCPLYSMLGINTCPVRR